MDNQYNLATMIKDEKDVEVFGGSNTPKLQRQLINVNKEYTFAISEGYIRAIDAMIEYLNNAEVPRAVISKVMLVMTSLVLDDEDIKYLKNTKEYSESGVAIPTMTEVQYINDIPLQFDIIEAVYLYILRIARESGFYSQSGIFGDLDISGVMFSNAKNLSDVYQSYVVGVNGEVMDINSNRLAQKITDLCRANNVVRERLMKLANGGKKPSKKEELDIRRKFKFDPVSGSFQKRLAPISKVVLPMLANKSEVVYVELKNLLK